MLMIGNLKRWLRDLVLIKLFSRQTEIFSPSAYILGNNIFREINF